MGLINKLVAIGDAIREKTGETDLYTLDEMATKIANITVGEGSGGADGYVPTDSDLRCEGIFQYKFAFDSWNWIIDNYGDRITTSNLSNLLYVFYNSKNLTYIPFDINCDKGTKSSATNMFRDCQKLTSVPKINNLKVEAIDNFLAGCNNIREVPEDFDENWDWSYVDSLTNGYAGNRCNTFSNCYSLRKFPMNFLNHGNPKSSPSYTIYSACFTNCYALDEIVGLPFPHNDVAFTSATFNGCFNYCSRLKDMTFATQENGTPYTVQWKSQTIDLTTSVGYFSNHAQIANRITPYNSGITEDKEVLDDATYQALKNDPDWFATSEAYSRYNHDSAVNTINSLPDASAYLATAGGPNTIKFKGAAGSATDGGAINTLTEEEIAVAAAKGWTVTFAQKGEVYESKGI